MKDFLKKVLIFSLLFFLLDKGAYFILVRFQDKVHDRRLEKVIDGEINKDIVAVGSSRGAKAILAQQIEDSTDFTAYNLCYHASDISFHEFMVRTLLKFNQTPKVILLSVDDPQELWAHENYHFPSFDLYPLLHRHHINEALIDVGEHGVVTRFLYTSRIKQQHWFPEVQAIDPFDSVWACGSQPIRHYADNRAFERYVFNYELEKELDWKVRFLQDIEAHCQDYGVKLVLVYPPNYKVHNTEFVDRMKELTGEDVLHCVYDYQDTTYDDKSLYFDPDHLHLSGAQKFTNEIITFLDSLELE